MAPTPTTDARRVDALQFIFSFFLGILLVVVVGVGVWTFYPQPFSQDSADQKQLDKLYRQQEQINMASGGKSLDATQTAESNRIQDEIDTINESMQEQRDAWAVTTSIILLVFATTLMAISLLLPEHMRVFSNGVLLGGVFTVIYGTAWSFAGGDSLARFFVVLVALALSVLFGYLRFIRGRREGAPATTAAAAATGAATGVVIPADSEGLASLETRVRELEAKAAAAAAAFGGSEDKS